MSEQSRAVMHRWFEQVWNQKDSSVIDELFTADTVSHGLGGPEGDMRGPEAFKRFQQGLLQAFPDLRITVQEVVAEGDRVAVRYSFTGTHAGEVPGVAPTHEAISGTGITLAHLRDGKIVEGWNEVNMPPLVMRVAEATA